MPSPLVGRDDELATLKALLHKPSCRLLTLLGMGGTGKTRLAEQFRDDSTLFPHECVFVPLGGVNSADYLVSAIAEALQLSFYAPEAPRTQLLRVLADKSLLLILDNFEHLLIAADLLAQLLRAAPALKLLVTSRERLNLREEWVYEVRGLAFPPSDNSPLDGYGAVQLFVQCAAQLRPGFALSPADAPYINRICRLVAGLPLGIELAAAWVRVLSVREIAEAIESNLDFLSTSWTDVPERHRNISAVFEHSWTRLTAEEQDVFRRLSVFRGGFTRAAAEAVAGASLSTLMSLIDRSLITRGSMRYDMHELLRQFAARKLGEAPAARDETQNRYIGYFAGFVGRHSSSLKGEWQSQAMHTLGVDTDNIRAAWHSAVAAGDWSHLEAMWEGVWQFYEGSSGFHEGGNLFSHAVRTLRPDPGDNAQVMTYTILRLLESWAIFRMGRFESAKTMLLAIQQDAGALLQPEHNMRAFWLLSHVLMFTCHELGQIDEALVYTRNALEYARRLETPYYIASALFNLGRVVYSSGNYESAQVHLQEALNFCLNIGSDSGIAYCLYELGKVALAQCKPDEAVALLRESEARFREYGHLWGMGVALIDMARALREQGRTDEVAQALHEALQIGAHIHVLQLLVDTLGEIAVLFAIIGENERAVELLMLVLAHPVNWRGLHDRAEHTLATVQSRLGTDAFATAQARGRARTVDETVKSVLADYDRLLAALQPSTPLSRVASDDELTPRELEVLRLMAEGLSNREISQRLVIQPDTARKHVNQILHKLGASNRTRAVTIARKRGLLPS